MTLQIRKRAITLIASAMIALFSFAQKPELVVSSDTIGSNGIIQIPIILKGASGFCAFQFSIRMPDGIRPVTATDDISPVIKGNLTTNHEIDYNQKENSGTNGYLLNVACISMDNAVFTADSGLICTVNLQADNPIQENKTITIGNIELSTPDVRKIRIGNSSITVYPLKSQETPGTNPVVNPDTIPTVNPDTVPTIIPPITDPEFNLTISPFTFSGSFQSSIIITSDADIKSISFLVSVPEQFTTNKLIDILNRMTATDYRTEIKPINKCTYSIAISALNNNVIPSGSFEIAGVNINYVIGLIPPDIYLISLDMITITTTDGKVYNPKSFTYNIDFTFTNVESTIARPDDTVTYYTLDGQQVSAPVKGITLVRYSNGRVSKLINR